ncbi:hypothetical protein [Planktothrix phage Pra-JY27]|nr:alpha/beta hydrolase family protein [Planktothrix phage Pag-Yong1]WEV89269.1 hypothetical protein [Synechococcus phage MinM2]
MNKDAFLAAYRQALIETYDWARNPAKLDLFLASVRATLDGARTWNHDGECVTRAWREIGGKGKPTLTALRALA